MGTRRKTTVLPGYATVTTKSYNGGKLANTSVVSPVIANFEGTDWTQTSTTGNFVNPNPFDFTKKTWTGLTGSYSMVTNVKDNTGTWIPQSETTRSGAMLSVAAAPTVPPPGLSSYAYNQALDKLGEQVRGSLDWSINAFEAKRTAAMAKSAFNVLQRITGRNNGAYLAEALKKAPENASAAWLMFQYGLRPLYNDLYATAEKLAKHGTPPRRFTGRGKATDASTSSSGSGVYTFATITTRTSHSYRVEIGIELDGEKDYIQKLSEWTSLNPINIAWELMPYSFVADWLVDVGGFLRSMETAMYNQKSFARGYVTHTHMSRVEQTLSLRSDLPRTQSSVRSISGQGTSEYRSCHREVISEYPLPKLPTFYPKLGWQRLLSAASLLTQAFSKVRK